jgi:DNA-binding response OmpR family regulator
MVIPGTTPLPARCRVLLVEDDDAARTLYAAALSREGFYVRSAPDGMAALRMLESYDPDVVILDLRLPIADGFEVLRELRGDRAHATLPVIAVSGHEGGLARARTDPDFFAALQKPFDPDDLIDVTRRAAVRPYRPEGV